jgi:hypothetical protein
MTNEDCEFEIGARVKLNRLGLSRSPKIGARLGVVEGVGPTGNAIRVRFDAGRAAITVHRSYLEVVREEA